MKKDGISILEPSYFEVLRKEYIQEEKSFDYCAAQGGGRGGAPCSLQLSCLKEMYKSNNPHVDKLPSRLSKEYFKSQEIPMIIKARYHHNDSISSAINR
uniref:Uncharacterized protein n=1 Tax=Metapenaeus joyneri majanivirus TaxID=2984280 RepID=A0A9C7CDT5_9VIRU|nr:MAG: hypothetical protein [Metapenaeus joyneri majanivirus]